ncbi:MAG: hypothetical protein JRC86_00555 [Deltaproteobacteria bacterium]|nr:hypothetical protein [Deltaproteobacteria bacterium]
MRKTLKVKDLIDKVNCRNRHSTTTPEKRAGWNSILEAILLETGTYAGFGYLLRNEVPDGEKPGIIPDPTERGTNHEFPDETRRKYYYYHGLVVV